MAVLWFRVQMALAHLIDPLGAHCYAVLDVMVPLLVALLLAQGIQQGSRAALARPLPAHPVRPLPAWHRPWPPALAMVLARWRRPWPLALATPFFPVSLNGPALNARPLAHLATLRFSRVGG